MVLEGGVEHASKEGVQCIVEDAELSEHHVTLRRNACCLHNRSLRSKMTRRQLSRDERHATSLSHHNAFHPSWNYFNTSYTGRGNVEAQSAISFRRLRISSTLSLATLALKSFNLFASFGSPP